MPFEENISLKNLNSFGIDAFARQFSSFRDTAELGELLSQAARKKVFILGGGSNILLSGDIESPVLKNEIRGIEKVKEDEDFVFVKAGAGENWHQFVLHCIENGWGGVENLSLIPGNVGAAPMQNIGAYGVELKDIFQELKAFNIEEKSNYNFGLKDCAFGYRESVFKGKYRDQFVILNVTFRLRKKPQINTSYGALQQELEKAGITNPSIKDVSDAVIRIRTSKLPDPVKIGNAGSFFKNPVVPAETFAALTKRFDRIVGYENTDGSVKLAAGWLIEHCGPAANTSWKGYREGDAGCHEKQALVLVNYGNAKGGEILDLSERIQSSVLETFGVKLEREVNVI